MRLIGHINGSSSAQQFGDFLYAKGLDNRVDRSGSGDQWEVWVLSEDDVNQAKSYLQQFQQRPGDAYFAQEAMRARDLRLEAAMAQQAHAQKMQRSREAVQSLGRLPLGRWTTAIMAR